MIDFCFTHLDSARLVPESHAFFSDGQVLQWPHRAALRVSSPKFALSMCPAVAWVLERWLPDLQNAGPGSHTAPVTQSSLKSSCLVQAINVNSPSIMLLNKGRTPFAILLQLPMLNICGLNDSVRRYIQLWYHWECRPAGLACPQMLELLYLSPLFFAQQCSNLKRFCLLLIWQSPRSFEELG